MLHHVILGSMLKQQNGVENGKNKIKGQLLEIPDRFLRFGYLLKLQTHAKKKKEHLKSWRSATTEELESRKAEAFCSGSICCHAAIAIPNIFH